MLDLFNWRLPSYVPNRSNLLIGIWCLVHSIRVLIGSVSIPQDTTEYPGYLIKIAAQTLIHLDSITCMWLILINYVFCDDIHTNSLIQFIKSNEMLFPAITKGTWSKHTLTRRWDTLVLTSYRWQTEIFTKTEPKWIPRCSIWWMYTVPLVIW